MMIKRGDVFWVNLDPIKGSEQAGRRPVIVVQNDVSNEFAATTIVVPTTTTTYAKEYPTNVFIHKGIGGLKADSTALLQQIRVIDKTRLESKLGHLPSAIIHKIDFALKVSLALE